MNCRKVHLLLLLYDIVNLGRAWFIGTKINGNGNGIEMRYSHCHVWSTNKKGNAHYLEVPHSFLFRNIHSIEF